MKHPHADYQDQVICIRSLRELMEDVHTLDSHPDPEVKGMIDKIRSNINGGRIPREEPVMLFRGQERYAPHAVKQWAYKLGSDKHPTHIAPMVTTALQHAELMEKWPVSKVPDMPLKPSEQLDATDTLLRKEE